MKRKNLAIIGFGARGGIYGQFAQKNPNKFNLVAVAETDDYRRNVAEKDFGAKPYVDYKEMLDAGHELDLVAVCTQDAQHKEHALYALEKGYDLLLEKPISNDKNECIEIYEKAKACNRKVFVCHVLRYTPFYSLIKEIIDSGELGEIINVHASENIGYYHFAHSYVRGPWRNSATSSPIILAKCCHDMDIVRYLIGEKCVSVNSYGTLSHFTAENAPKGATQYCTDCPNKSSCAYDAEKIYKANRFFAGYFTNGDLTEENIMNALPHCQYDRCVYGGCDNDVADHQSTTMLFENGKTATHSMTAFSKNIYRDIKIHGTKAELYGVMEKQLIEIRPFDGETRIVDFDTSLATVGGHGGGDYFMMTQLWKVLNGEEGKGITYLDVSIESHLMSFAAEESRLNGGKSVKI